MTRKLNKLKEDQKITQKDLEYLRPSTTPNVPRFYGTPKIHKEGAPIRPIVDYTGSATYNVARSLADLLTPLFGNTEHHVKNSKDLVHKLENIKVQEDECLISHDVVSLFTNVPIPEALKIIRDRLEKDEKLKDRTNLTVNDIMELLAFVCEKTYFIFRGQLYEQQYGTAMGSPVSPIIANIYMEHLEQLALATCPSYYKPKVWYRYVDDIFEIAKKNHLDELTDHLNNTDPTGSIKFTMEQENNRCLPVLDILVTRTDDGHLSTKVYRKKTHTDQYLNYQSHHPLHQKLGVIRSLLDRKDHIVKEELEKEEEVRHITKALKQNKYPKWAIDLAKQKHSETKDKVKQKKGKESTNTPKQLIVLPYISKTSEHLAKIYKEFGITTAMKPATTLRSMLVHPKDKISKENTSGVVYEIPCKNCNRSYIGETGRNLGVRMKEHKTDVQNNQRVQYTRAARKRSETEWNKSAITDHTNKENHVINWDKTKVLAKESHRQKRWIREAIEIRKKGTTMNRDQGNYQLPPIYHSLLPVDVSTGS